jgi:hypothetical protein
MVEMGQLVPDIVSSLARVLHHKIAVYSGTDLLRQEVAMK